MTGRIIPFRGETGLPERSDVERLSVCAHGDMGALGELFDAHSSTVRRFVTRMVGPRADVDDLVQTTFLEVQRSAGRFAGQASVRTWILGIAANVCRRHNRALGRWLRLKEALVRGGSAEPWETTLLPAERRVLLACVSEALAQLPERQRETFVLCDVEGVACVEAAQVLNVPVGTVYRRLHDARTALRNALSEAT